MTATNFGGQMDLQTSTDRQLLHRSIMKTLAYADVFDYPPTAGEIHRYLVGESVQLKDLQEELKGQVAAGNLITRDGFFALPGRAEIIETRIHRSKKALDLWPEAVRYGKLLARLPFVRMVAVTGSLAMNNEPASDIDYLIVTQPRRLWLCRGLVILVVFIARYRGIEVCPNYLVSETALEFKRRDLYVAHEITQMMPLYGLQIYWRMRETNSWTAKYLPNATGLPRDDISAQESRPRSFSTLFAEWLLNSPPAGWLEKWEMNRKIRKFQSMKSPSEEIEFSEDLCKGHFGEYGKQTMAVYRERTGEV